MEVIHVKKNLRRRWAIPNSYGVISSYAVCKAPSIFSVAITVFLVLRRRSGLFQSSISACTVYATTAACVSSRCCCRGCCGCKISPQQSWRFIPAQADNRLLDRFVVVAVVVMVVVVDDYCTPICFVYHVAVMKRNCALPTTLPELFDRPLCAGHCFTMPTISCSSVIWGCH